MPIELQLFEERASALKRVGGTLEKQLAELSELAQRIVGLSGAERKRAVARYQELWTEADRQRWYLIIQREAMGVTGHEDVDRCYPPPPRLS
jgi:hypothetical protein